VFVDSNDSRILLTARFRWNECWKHTYPQHYLFSKGSSSTNAAEEVYSTHRTGEARASKLQSPEKNMSAIYPWHC